MLEQKIFVTKLNMKYPESIYQIFWWLPVESMAGDLHKWAEDVEKPEFIVAEYKGKHPDLLLYNNELYSENIALDFKDVKKKGEYIFNDTSPCAKFYYVLRQKQKKKIIILSGSGFNPHDLTANEIQFNLLSDYLDDGLSSGNHPQEKLEMIEQCRSSIINFILDGRNWGKTVTKGSLSSRARFFTTTFGAPKLFKMVEINTINLFVVTTLKEDEINVDKTHMASQLGVEKNQIRLERHYYYDSNLLIYSRGMDEKQTNQHSGTRQLSGYYKVSQRSLFDHIS